uniref:Uncharacterized protein n=1 Tax=Trichobilharzia regenti TaxID=157069 RepID=A0AA85K4Q8_TRIRE|nr:unnamed protein product [Trichobilharzia regenti]
MYEVSFTRSQGPFSHLQPENISNYTSLTKSLSLVIPLQTGLIGFIQIPVNTRYMILVTIQVAVDVNAMTKYQVYTCFVPVCDTSVNGYTKTRITAHNGGRNNISSL